MTKFIAHRGASSLAPENTLKAFKIAQKLQVDFVEFDVRLSKDSIPVVIHDPVIEQAETTYQKGSIDSLTLKEIKQWNIEGEPIPTLKEVFELDWKDMGLMLEIKDCGHQNESLVAAIFDILNHLKLLPKLIIGSFSPEIILKVEREVKLYELDISLIGIVEEIAYIDRFIDMKVHHLAVFEELITQELVSNLHAKGIELWVFTVDDINRAKELINCGVDGIISNKIFSISAVSK